MITLLRHGRTDANAGGLLQGRLDRPLDDLGRSQAEAAGMALGPVDRVICSPLLRTRQTAEYLDGPVTIDDRFVELDYGDWDGKPLAEVPADVWGEWQTNLGLRPPNGETLLELGARVRVALDELLAGYNDGSLSGHTVVVSHVSPIKAAVAWALQVDDAVSWRMHLTTASITTIAVNRGRPSLTGFNNTSHHPS